MCTRAYISSSFNGEVISARSDSSITLALENSRRLRSSSFSIQRLNVCLSLRSKCSSISHVYGACYFYISRIYARESNVATTWKKEFPNAVCCDHLNLAFITSTWGGRSCINRFICQSYIASNANHRTFHTRMEQTGFSESHTHEIFCQYWSDNCRR